MWIMQIPVVSTRHITPQTMQAITGLADNLPVVVAPTPWGAFVGVGEADTSDTDAPYQDLYPLFKWAQDNDYEWIRLDADGDEVDDLPTYEW